MLQAPTPPARAAGAPLRAALAARGLAALAALCLALAASGARAAIGPADDTLFEHPASAAEAPAFDDSSPEDPSIELPPGLELHAGDRFEVRWTLPGDGVDELEILLSIDGGRRFALRVSPELEAREGRYLWRVPNLASADARLKIRFHRAGREIDGPMSRSFTLIRNDARVDAAPVHEGTWWAGLEGSDRPHQAGALSESGDRIVQGRELPATGPSPAAPETPRRLGVVAARPAPRTAPSIPSLRASHPRFHPLRN